MLSPRKTTVSPSRRAKSSPIVRGVQNNDNRMMRRVQTEKRENFMANHSLGSRSGARLISYQEFRCFLLPQHPLQRPIGTRAAGAALGRRSGVADVATHLALFGRGVWPGSIATLAMRNEVPPGSLDLAARIELDMQRQSVLISGAEA